MLIQPTWFIFSFGPQPNCLPLSLLPQISSNGPIPYHSRTMEAHSPKRQLTMSSPLNKCGGFYYDIKGHIQPRRYFDHAGRPLPGNTKNTSYYSIRLPFRLKAWNPRAQRWASLGGGARHRRRRAARQQASRSSPLFTSSMKPEFLLAQYGRKEPSLRLKLLREKAKEAYVHLLVLEWAWLAHQLDKMRRAGTAAEHSDPGSGSGSGSIYRTTPAPGRDLTRNKRGDLETRRSDVMDRLDECDARPYNSEEQSEPPKDEDDRPASDSVIGSTRRRYHARAASSPAAQRARDRQERIWRSSRARQPPPSAPAPAPARALPGWLSIARARFDAVNELDHQRHHQRHHHRHHHPMTQVEKRRRKEILQLRRKMLFLIMFIPNLRDTKKTTRKKKWIIGRKPTETYR